MGTKQATQRQRVIVAEIAKIGFCLPGSVVVRTNRCGNPRCACHADPDRRHGPYQLWTRKVAGKTVTKTLSDDQAERYRSWFDNERRLRELLAELEQLSIETMARAEGWPEPEPAPPDRRRHRSDSSGTPPAVGHPPA